MEPTIDPLSYATGLNHYLVDPVFVRITQDLMAASFTTELAKLGAFVGDQVLPVGNEIDRAPSLTLISHDLDGNRIDQVRLTTSHATTYEQLRHLVSTPWTGAGFLGHFLQGYLVADPGFYCLLTLSTQVASALHLLLPNPERYLERLTTGPSWGGTWFTETHAGSDLAATRTQARQTDSGWILSGGDKYFASGAGLTDLAITSAYPAGATSLRQLHLYLTEKYTNDGELNFTLRRLKSKLATKAIPTGEIELAESHATLLAGENEGIYRILQSLTLARTANAMASAGVARIATIEATLRGERRSAFGHPLREHPLFARDLVMLRLAHLGVLSLALLGAETFQQSYAFTDHNDPDYLLLRLLSHATKTHTAKHSTIITQLAMECFGGLGFLEDYAIARWHREALVLPIWEGSANIHALDAAEVLRHPDAVIGIRALLTKWVPDSLHRSVLMGAEKALEGLSGEAWYWKEALELLGECLEVAALGRFAADVPELADVAELRWRYFQTHSLPVWRLPEALRFTD
ncbi:acyl-CoA dehydrogenase family protein [Ferrimicrobium sp.]|uniref:acyl-CoA dehydrogenase family protein n=1 Tax=Ferrimicrobium sp. TaxID=2926050 RepID=UPI00260C1B65|nr:acyl-CoA dehydrogenase family protein [Ferrimicrobium sp.]